MLGEEHRCVLPQHSLWRHTDIPKCQQCTLKLFPVALERLAYWLWEFVFDRKSKTLSASWEYSFSLQKQADYGIADLVRSVWIKEFSSDSDPIGLVREVSDNSMHWMTSRLCSLLTKKLFTLLGADLHHFIIHRPAFWQPRRIYRTICQLLWLSEIRCENICVLWLRLPTVQMLDRSRSFLTNQGMFPWLVRGIYLDRQSHL